VLVNPTHVVQQLTNGSIPAAGKLKFDEHEFAVSIPRQNIDETGLDWKLDSVVGDFLIKLQAILDDL